ncbi:MAG: 1-(5-phosphoribosyl)-5-[(5-phosphoribosylamino) methylideneamino]imidazole-4-carboxamide isomerase [Anaerolineales bacterium]
MIVYPAIDLRGGRVVRLQQGDPARMTWYSDDPAGTARRWLEAGAEWLHVVNLEGAFGERDALNRQALEAILKCGARVQFGGGMRSLKAVARALDLGVSRVVLGTAAVENPDMVAQALTRFGAEKIAVGIDARDGRVRTRGWQTDGGVRPLDLALHLRALSLRTVIFTDIRRDGLGSGLNLAATREIADAGGLEVIASGGVHTLADVRAVKEAGLAGVIIGRALYEGALDLREALQLQD